jgi:HB1, ASXL, restriction endonuclease HTH domain
MDLTGQHSNPAGPLRAVLAWAATVSEGRDSTAKPAPRIEPKRAAGAIGASHQRHDWVVAAVISVLEMHPGPMHAREVHRAVEAMMGRPVRWASVKACLAVNVAGTAPRFVRVARGQYRLAG